jgi:hypothetical protein
MLRHGPALAGSFAAAAVTVIAAPYAGTAHAATGFGGCPAGQFRNDTGYCIPLSEPGDACAKGEPASKCGPPAAPAKPTAVRFCRVAPPASTTGLVAFYTWNGNAYASVTTSCATAHAIFWAVVGAFVQVSLAHDDAAPPPSVLAKGPDHAKLVVHVAVNGGHNRYYGYGDAAVICTTGAPTSALVVFPGGVLVDAANDGFPDGL